MAARSFPLRFRTNCGARSPATRRLKLELLEDRLLLTNGLEPLLPWGEVAKEGPLAKLDTTLAGTFHEFQAFRQGGGSQETFSSHNPFARGRGERVVIDAVASQDSGALRRDLEALGLLHGSTMGRMVSGQLPIDALAAAAGLDSLRFARSGAAVPSVGLVDGQGQSAIGGDLATDAYGLDGTGITVGTLSDTFDSPFFPLATSAADDVANGDLPAGIVIFDDTAGPGSDEGRAMMQLIADVAPGASQAFHTAANGEADFALGIQELAGCPPGSAPGCTPVPGVAADVIVDDLMYLAEPMFQDGLIAQAVDLVQAAGISYFSAAGNMARAAYEQGFRNSGIDLGPAGTGAIPTAFEAHDFDPGPGVDTFQSVTFSAGLTLIVLQYDDPFFSVSGAPGADTDLDIALFDSFGFSFGSFAANVGGDPVEILAVGCGSFSGCPAEIAIGKFSGPDPDLLKYVSFNSAFAIDEYGTQSGTIYGHANAAGAETVGAAFYADTPAYGFDPAVVEPFSSAGAPPGGPATPILFRPDGTPTFELRDKPDVIAADGSNTTFFASVGDVEPDGFPNFFGTSAAAPVAAAAAALLLQGDATLTPDDVYRRLEQTAVDMDDPATPGFDAGFDPATGHGLIQLDQALKNPGASYVDANNDGRFSGEDDDILLVEGELDDGQFDTDDAEGGYDETVDGAGLVINLPITAEQIEFVSTGNLIINADLKSTDEDIQLESAGGSVLLDDPTVDAREDLEIAAQADFVSSDDAVRAGEDLQLEIDGNLEATGTVFEAGEDVELKAGGDIILIGSKVEADDDVALQADGKMAVRDRGVLLTNPSFEAGDFTGWTTTVPVGGFAQIVTSHATVPIGPVFAAIDGGQYALLKTDGAGSFTSLAQSFTGSAGDTISGWAFFDSGDVGGPVNDLAEVRIFDSAGTPLMTVFYADADQVNLGQTLWTPWSFRLPASGTYMIEGRVTNAFDDIFDSFLGFDLSSADQAEILAIGSGGEVELLAGDTMDVSAATLQAGKTISLESARHLKAVNTSLLADSSKKGVVQLTADGTVDLTRATLRAEKRIRVEAADQVFAQLASLIATGKKGRVEVQANGDLDLLSATVRAFTKIKLVSIGARVEASAASIAILDGSTKGDIKIEANLAIDIAGATILAPDNLALQAPLIEGMAAMFGDGTLPLL